MPWLMGIDEAGYGPNLGPLVQACVGVWVSDPEISLWDQLSDVVMRAKEKNKTKLMIDDSKLVYQGNHALRKLERGVLTALAPDVAQQSTSWHSLLERWAKENTLQDLDAENWFVAEETIPAAVTTEDLQTIQTLWGPACQHHQLCWSPSHCVVVPAKRFNQIVEASGTKATVLMQGVQALLRQSVELLPNQDNVLFSIDKLGGRNYYSNMLYEAFPDTWITTLQENSEACKYRLTYQNREIELCFQPRSDHAHLVVALASMLAKYIREICMEQFNRFWQSKISGLKPTAGYPVDAARFLRDLEPTIKEMQLDRDTLWRKK